MSDLELFRQAINEGFNQRIDKILESESDEISCSKKHEIAMRTILRGKIPTEGKRSSTRARLIIIIAAVILSLALVGCAIIYRYEIGELAIQILERYDFIVHSDSTKNTHIEEVYELTYLPEGYELSDTFTSSKTVSYIFVNAQSAVIGFYQDGIGNSLYHVDNEHGDTKTIQIGEHTIYYRDAGDRFIYMWDDEKYIFTLTSSFPFSDEELTLILEGIKIK